MKNKEKLGCRLKLSLEFIIKITRASRQSGIRDIKFMITARPRGTLSTWQKKYSVSRNDLSWGTMYILLCQLVSKIVCLGVSTLY